MKLTFKIAPFTPVILLASLHYVMANDDMIASLKGREEKGISGKIPPIYETYVAKRFDELRGKQLSSFALDP